MFKEHRAIILLLGSLTALGPLTIDMYLPSFPDIALSLGESTDRIQYSLSSFFVGLAIGQLFYGPITDRYGRKLPIYIGLAIYLISAIACAFTDSLEMLVAMRFLQGIGGSAGMVVARAVVRDKFEAQDSARVFSTLMLIMGIAPILAPILGSWFSEYLGWRSIFIILTAFSALLFALVYWRMEETHGFHADVKLSNTFRVYKDVITDKIFVFSTLSGNMIQAGMFAYITGSAFVIIELFGFKQLQYSWIFGANAGGLILSSQFNSRLLRKFSIEQMLNITIPTTFILGLLLMGNALFHWSPTLFLINLFLFISSLGMILPNATARALSSQGSRAGSASALMGTIQFTIASLASAAVSTFHNDTALPMAMTIAICGLLSFIFHRLTVAANN